MMERYQHLYTSNLAQTHQFLTPTAVLSNQSIKLLRLTDLLQLCLIPASSYRRRTR